MGSVQEFNKEEFIRRKEKQFMRKFNVGLGLFAILVPFATAYIYQQAGGTYFTFLEMYFIYGFLTYVLIKYLRIKHPIGGGP